MENQQERLIWLAGFIDGEGYFGINKIDRVNRWSGLQMTPRFSITNTSKPAFEKVGDILRENNLAFYIAWKAPGKDKRTKWQWQIEVSGVKRLARFLPVIIPHLVVKKEQSEVLLNYCRSRMERTSHHLGSKGLPKYTEEDIQVWRTIKELNQYPQRTYAEPVEGRYVPSHDESHGDEQKCLVPA
jgi:hypothetical protein